MKEIKVIVSPHFNEEEFEDKVSGITFKKGTGVTIYSIDIEENKLSGIQSALRKNVLLPYDRQTLEFVNGNNLAKDEVVAPAKEEVKEEVQEDVVLEAKEDEVEEPVKKTRKPRTKKETE